MKLHRLQTFRNHASDSSSLLLTAILVLVVEYQIVLSRPVHISEAVFSPGQCLGHRLHLLHSFQIHVSVFWTQYNLHKFGVHKLLELKEVELKDKNID